MATADVCVICNPASGKGRGARRLEKLRRALGPRAEFWPTCDPGRGEELAFRAAGAGFATVAAAGGDGTVHEVANGVVRAGRPDVTLAVIPVGSANDYAHSLGLAADWWARPDPGIIRRRVDVGVVRSGARSRYFVNGVGLGFNGAVTRESKHIRHLQGLVLYGCALLRALCFHYTRPVLSVELDGGPARTGPTLALSLAIGRREGNFVVAPDAVLDDGLFDYLYVGDLSRSASVPLLPGLFRGKLGGHPALQRGRCKHVVVRGESPLMVHVDGEFFCLPEDGVRELEVGLLPGALTVFARLPRQPGPTGKLLP
jgi:diacylglycerol kinase family enzyme